MHSFTTGVRDPHLLGLRAGTRGQYKSRVCSGGNQKPAGDCTNRHAFRSVVCRMRIPGDRKSSPAGTSFFQISQSFFYCLDFRFHIRQIFFQFCDLLGLGLISALEVRLVTAATLVVTFCAVVITRSVAIAFVFTHIELSFLKLTVICRPNPSPARKADTLSRQQNGIIESLSHEEHIAWSFYIANAFLDLLRQDTAHQITNLDDFRVSDLIHRPSAVPLWDYHPDGTKAGQMPGDIPLRQTGFPAYFTDSFRSLA